jgi:hypothetical protein
MIVMPGLDPGIHQSAETFSKDGLPGRAWSSPAMTDY